MTVRWISQSSKASNFLFESRKSTSLILLTRYSEIWELLKVKYFSIQVLFQILFLNLVRISQNLDPYIQIADFLNLQRNIKTLFKEFLNGQRKFFQIQEIFILTFMTFWYFIIMNQKAMLNFGNHIKKYFNRQRSWEQSLTQRKSIFGKTEVKTNRNGSFIKKTLKIWTLGLTMKEKQSNECSQQKLSSFIRKSSFWNTFKTNPSKRSDDVVESCRKTLTNDYKSSHFN